MPNQPKKHKKNANHVMWNVRMGAVVKLNREIFVAFPLKSTLFSNQPTGWR